VGNLDRSDRGGYARGDSFPHTAPTAADAVIHVTVRARGEAVRERRARYRLRDLLILAARTLAILLLALALARPQWGDRPLVSDDQAEAAVRVVLVDVSQSMAATEGGIEGMERARTVAARFLRYRPDLRANLILAGAQPQAVFEHASTNFDALRDELAHCGALPQRLDVNRALALAAEMLAPVSDSDQSRRELIVVSDFQRANWAKADFSQLPAKTQIQLESIAPQSQPANIAILRAEGRALNARGRSVQLQVEVGNFGPAARKVVVEAVLGESIWRLHATCPAGRTTTLSEEIQLRDVGWQYGRATLIDADDALAADNTRPLVVQVRPKPVYAIITRQSSTRRPSSSSSSSYFLECALLPDARLKDDASAKVLRVDPSEVDAASLSRVDLILLDHPGKLSDEVIKLLADLLRRGRRIVYVAAELIDATNLKRLSDTCGSGLQLPVEFFPPTAGRIRRDLYLASVAEDLPPFDVFADNLAPLIGRLRFAGGLGSRRLEGTLDDDIRATYNDGSACLVVSSSDAGALAVLNVDLAASNLPRTPAFVPLMDELVEEMLRSHRIGPTAYCGEPFVVQLPTDAGSAAGLRICGPQTSRSTAEETDGNPQFGELNDGNLGVTWHCPAPATSGVYRVCREKATVFSLPVNVPEEESRLDSLPSDVLTGRLAAGMNTYYRHAAGQSGRRDDAWIGLVVACLVCMLGELVVLLAFRT